MAETVQEFIKKYTPEKVHTGTGIHKSFLSRYASGQQPNQFNAILLYNFSLQVRDPLDALKPQENMWYVQLAQLLIRHKKSPYAFAHENDISDSSFLNLVNGEVRDINRIDPENKRRIYEGTVKLGDPFETFKPAEYEGPLQAPEQTTRDVPSPVHTITPTVILELKGRLTQLFDAAVSLLPYVRDSLDLENLKKLATTQLGDKAEMPRVAQNAVYGLNGILEYYATAPPKEREEFRRIFYSDKRAVITLAQLIDSLQSEEGVERLKSLRTLR